MDNIPIKAQEVPHEDLVYRASSRNSSSSRMKIQYSKVASQSWQVSGSSQPLPTDTHPQHCTNRSTSIETCFSSCRTRRWLETSWWKWLKGWRNSIVVPTAPMTILVDFKQQPTKKLLFTWQSSRKISSRAQLQLQNAHASQRNGATHEEARFLRQRKGATRGIIRSIICAAWLAARANEGKNTQPLAESSEFMIFSTLVRARKTEIKPIELHCLRCKIHPLDRSEETHEHDCSREE